MNANSSADGRAPDAASPSRTRSVRRPDRLELYLAEASQLFNSWDPSPFQDRDLDSNAADYILDWARDAPAKGPLSLVVHVGGGFDCSSTRENIASESVHDHFRRRAAQTRRQLSKMLRWGRMSMAIALVFLAVVVVVGEWLARHLADGGYAELIEHSLVIGAWVALWRPLEIFLYDHWPLRAEAKLCDRLADMEVRIVSAAVPTLGSPS